MVSIIHKERRKSQRIPVELQLLAHIDGRPVPMHTANISLDGMFIYAREFISPCAGFFAYAWPWTLEEPLHLYLTASLFEQTWAGYGIGAYISGISAADRAVWERFYHSRAAIYVDPHASRSAASERPRRAHRIVVIAGALNLLAMQALRRQGYDVSEVDSVEQALVAAGQQDTDLIISDLRRPGLDGMALCCYVNLHGLSARTLVLTDSSTQKEFLLGLFAGATRVIARTSTTDLLVSCVAEMIKQPLPLRRPALVGAAPELACAS